MTWFSIINDSYLGAVTNYDWWIFVKAEKGTDGQITFTYSNHLPWAAETETTKKFMKNVKVVKTWNDVEDSALPYLLGLIKSVVPKK